MVHVVHKFDKPLSVVAHEDGIVVSSPKGGDVVLSPESAKATGERLIRKARAARLTPTHPSDAAEPAEKPEDER